MNVGRILIIFIILSEVCGPRALAIPSQEDTLSFIQNEAIRLDKENKVDSAVAYARRGERLAILYGKKRQAAEFQYAIGSLYWRAERKADSAFTYIKKCWDFYEKGELTDNFINLLFFKARVYLEINAIASSIAIFQTAIKYSQRSDVSPDVAIASYFGLMNVYSRIGDNPRALAQCLAALKMARKKKYPVNNFIAIYDNIALLYNNIHDYKSSLSYSKKIIEIGKQNTSLKKTNKFLETYINIGISYSELGNFDSAFYYLKTANILAQNYEIIPATKGAICLNLGEVFRRTQQNDSAIFYFRRAANILAPYPSEIETRAVANINIAFAAYDMGKVEAARRAAFSGLELAQQSQNPYIFQIAYEILHKIEAKAQNKKQAYLYYRLYEAYADSLYNEERQTAIANIETRYELETIEEKKQFLDKKNIQKQHLIVQERNNLQYLSIAGVLGLCFIGVLSLGFIKISIPFSASLVFVTLLLIFEFIRLLIGPYTDANLGDAPWIKYSTNILLAVVITPFHLWIEARLKNRTRIKTFFRPGDEAK